MCCSMVFFILQYLFFPRFFYVYNCISLTREKKRRASERAHWTIAWTTTYRKPSFIWCHAIEHLLCLATVSVCCTVHVSFYRTAWNLSHTQVHSNIFIWEVVYSIYIRALSQCLCELVSKPGFQAWCNTSKWIHTFMYEQRCCLVKHETK